MARLTFSIGTLSSLMGLAHWISPPVSLRGMGCSFSACSVVRARRMRAKPTPPPAWGQRPGGIYTRAEPSGGIGGAPAPLSHDHEFPRQDPARRTQPGDVESGGHRA